MSTNNTLRKLRRWFGPKATNWLQVLLERGWRLLPISRRGLNAVGPWIRSPTGNTYSISASGGACLQKIKGLWFSSAWAGHETWEVIPWELEKLEALCKEYRPVARK